MIKSSPEVRHLVPTSQYTLTEGVAIYEAIFDSYPRNCYCRKQELLEWRERLLVVSVASSNSDRLGVSACVTEMNVM